jgi:hypothetical protein
MLAIWCGVCLAFVTADANLWPVLVVMVIAGGSGARGLYQLPPPVAGAPASGYESGARKSFTGVPDVPRLMEAEISAEIGAGQAGCPSLA